MNTNQNQIEWDAYGRPADTEYTFSEGYDRLRTCRGKNPFGEWESDLEIDERIQKDLLSEEDEKKLDVMLDDVEKQAAIKRLYFCMSAECMHYLDRISPARIESAGYLYEESKDDSASYDERVLELQEHNLPSNLTHWTLGGIPIIITQGDESSEPDMKIGFVIVPTAPSRPTKYSLF